MAVKEEWYKTWFDTSYYHKLYQHRDDNEAAYFIQRLVDHLALKEGAKVMDLACGRGRHSITLFDAGFKVTGLDLSKNNIEHLKPKEEEGLQFHVWDMRDPFTEGDFDCVFNLFTSFGYFDTMADNLRVLRAVHRVLKEDGLFVLDYLNPGSIKDVDDEKIVKHIDGVSYETRKYLKNDKIRKDIRITDKEKVFDYQESVQLIDGPMFRKLFEEAGFSIETIFGDYALRKYSPESSPRIILVGKKSG